MAARAKRAEEYREKRRLENLAWEAGREERERIAKLKKEEEEKLRQIRLAKRQERALAILERADETFEEMKDYYGFPDYDINKLKSHEITSLATIKDMLAEGVMLDKSHLDTLRRIFKKSNPAG
jgi:hypothetical protein